MYRVWGHFIQLQVKYKFCYVVGCINTIYGVSHDRKSLETGILMDELAR